MLDMLSLNALSIICALAAVFLVAIGKDADSWGWFLFVAYCCWAVPVNSDDDEETEVEDETTKR